MGIRYTIEYGYGRRRASRSHGGIRALTVLALDLVLGLVFSLLRLALGLARWLVVAAWRASLAVISCPIWVARRLSAQAVRQEPKPKLALYREL